MRTLLIEDDEDQRSTVRSLLERAGIGPVHEAVDGPTGLEQATTFQPELVLLDVAMPGPSGLQILPELRRRAPEARIVVLSNFPRRQLGEVARQLGALGYVEKRVAPERLVAEILVAAALTELVLEQVTAQLPADPSSPRAARDLVGRAMRAEDDAVLGSVELLVSELVTNAVVHASSAPRIEVQLSLRGVRVEVFDEDPTMPAHRIPDAGRPGGRGLHLLDQLASRWGAEPREDGKVVWFEVDRSALSGLSPTS